MENTGEIIWNKVLYDLDKWYFCLENICLVYTSLALVLTNFVKFKNFIFLFTNYVLVQKM